MSAALEANPTIEHVKLRHNPIGTAAGLQLGVALARRNGAPCLVDIQGCVCFSDKTDIWAGLMASERAARAQRLAGIRKRNAAK